jgi:tetratricopeptide (TPR) repeat protein
MRRIKPLTIILFVSFLCLFSLAIYFLPPVHERLAWRVDELILRVRYTLKPPGQVIFVPQQGARAATQAEPPAHSTPVAAPLMATPAPDREAATLTAQPTAAPPTAMPTITPALLPEKVSLSGVRYQDQHGRYNYCAPANLAMALSYWGWEGNQDVVGPVIKPDQKDRNVMPYEMVDYVEAHTDLRALERVGGDLDMLRRFVAAGYAVLVERGVYLRDLTGVVSWMGHYQVITGYDDANEVFTAQDSFVEPDHDVPYEELLKHWRAFNYTYIIIYPPEKEQEVMTLLGPDADEKTNYENAALIASNEVYGLSGIDQYFAWYNRGTSLMKLQDYAGASTAYDEAFALYPTIPEAERPWRMLWYQTGPYFAYFYAQRYWDVLYLADGTLNAMQGDRNLEESYYWRAMAKAALGDAQGATQDFLTSLEYHEGFGPAVYQLSLLGVTP